MKVFTFFSINTKFRSYKNRTWLFVAAVLLSLFSFASCGGDKNAGKGAASRSGNAGGPRGSTEILKTSGGEVRLTPVKHATFVLSSGKTALYMDPTGKADAYRGLPAPSLILITHTHGDHMSPGTIKSLPGDKIIIAAPAKVVGKLKEAGVENGGRYEIRTMKNGDRATLAGIGVEAVPMYNLDPKRLRHKKGIGNGYVITMAGARFYVSGDTEDIPEMRALKNIDFAFVCMNLPFTMSAKKAADATLAFRPRVVYPFHYRGRGPGGTQDPGEFKKIVHKGSKEIEVRLRNWYPK